MQALPARPAAGCAARCGRRRSALRADRLALVGHERRDVDERGDVGVVAGLGDDDAAVGVADQHGRAAEAGEDLVSRGGVAGQRQVGGLHDCYPVAVSGEVIVDALPARSVHEVPVHEHDVPDGHGRS
jgi:hypothetical protein